MALPLFETRFDCRYCYVEFESKDVADQMKEEIPKITSNGSPFYADFVGERSGSHNRQRKDLDAHV